LSCAEELLFDWAIALPMYEVTLLISGDAMSMLVDVEGVDRLTLLRSAIAMPVLADAEGTDRGALPLQAIVVQ
jgi:hypothetical protein